jgi:hypothetical protein
MERDPVSKMLSSSYLEQWMMGKAQKPSDSVAPHATYTKL